MGMAANQARLLTLTARQHDLELRAQQISAQKMALMYQSQAQATAYANALASYSSNGVYQTGTYQEVPVDFNTEWFAQFSGSRTLYHFSNKVEADLTDLTDAKIAELIKAGYEPAIKTRTTTRPNNNTNTNPTSGSTQEEFISALANALTNRQIAEIGSHWYFTAEGYVQDGNKYYLQIKTSDIKDSRNEAYSLAKYGLPEKASIQQINEVIMNDSDREGGKDYTETDWYKYFLATGLTYFTAAQLAEAGISLPSNETSNDDEDGDVPPTETETVTYSYQRAMTTTRVWVPADNSENQAAATDFESAKAAYDSAMVALSNSEKLLDMELTQIDTEHKAVKTEYDSVKSLIKDNTEKSFNIFG